MKKIFITLIMLIMLLTGCSQSAGTSPLKTAAFEEIRATGSESAAGAAGTVLQNQEETGTSGAETQPSSAKSASRQIWDEYAAAYGRLNLNDNNDMIMPHNAPEAPDLLPLYLEGLKHENTYVRWACASKLFEFKFRSERPDIIEALKPLLEDKSEIVRKAAAFSAEVLEGSYDGPEFIRSSDGKFVVFFGFHDVQYNDGWIWMDNGDGGFYGVDAGGSLAGISISPDNSKLCYKTYGRYWSNVSVYDIKTGKTSYCGLFNYIADHKDKFNWKIGENQRPDPYVSYLEWSPDSKKLLLFLNFTDDGHSTHNVSAVYDVAGESFERIKVLPAKTEEDYNPEPVKPGGFRW